MIVINSFAGLATNASPYSLPPGAATRQVNLQILSPGQLTVRDALVSVSFATHTAGTASVVAAINFPEASVQQVVYQDSDGALYSAKGPS